METSNSLTVQDRLEPEHVVRGEQIRAESETREQQQRENIKIAKTEESDQVTLNADSWEQ
jgi:hypothetical protein